MPTDIVVVISGGNGTLNWCNSTNHWTSGTGTSPGGSPNQIQYNLSGAFAGFTMTGDCTAVVSTGVITCTKSSGTPFGTGAFLNNVTQTIANGSAALGTSAISSGSCASPVTVSTSGVATSDVIQATFNSDPTSTVGYIPSTSGGLTIFVYPTANNVNFKVCNSTTSSITPGAVTVNFRVTR